ncbi:MAG: hypothetical protein ACTTKI_00055 [Tannerella sp.]
MEEQIKDRLSFMRFWGLSLKVIAYSLCCTPGNSFR